MGKLIIGGSMIAIGKLKDIREDNDISQNEIANILDVPRSTYSMWELGICIVPIDYLCKLSDYYNLSIDYILGLTKEKGSKNLIKGFSFETLGNNLKSIRLKHKLSQENIANLLKVKQPCIYKYEKGKSHIPTSSLYVFAKEFNVSLSYLCGKSK